MRFFNKIGITSVKSQKYHLLTFSKENGRERILEHYFNDKTIMRFYELSEQVESIYGFNYEEKRC